MNASQVFRASTAGRTPLIQFLGKRSIPESIDHAPRPHPAAPTKALPNSFAEYRKKAQQHGPLGGYKATTAPSISPSKGQVSDRSELPPRFWRLTLSKEEMEVIESGGAAMA
jgi:small subunit ribosomal protein YMR-31